jgi:hypothetical protein
MLFGSNLRLPISLPTYLRCSSSSCGSGYQSSSLAICSTS